MTKPARPAPRRVPRERTVSTNGTAEPRPPARPTETAATDGSFPIVGIGASAGGLEALEEFLRHVPEASGMALVVVQHLDPTHKGVLAELL